MTLTAKGFSPETLNVQPKDEVTFILDESGPELITVTPGSDLFDPNLHEFTLTQESSTITLTVASQDVLPGVEVDYTLTVSAEGGLGGLGGMTGTIKVGGIWDKPTR